MRTKKILLVCMTLSVCLMTSNFAFARWKDVGQSEKYMEFWENKHQWESYAIEGYKMLLDQQYEKAIEQLEKAIRLGCTLGKVYFQLGLCQDKLNQTEQAAENYKKAIDVLSKNKEKESEEYLFLSHYNLGIILLEASKDKEAVEEFETALSMRSQDATTCVNLGYLYSRNDMNEKAMEAYQKAIANDPQLAIAHFNLGVLLRKNGQIEEANSHLNKAKELDPSIQSNVEKAATETREIKDPMSLTEEEVNLIRERAQGAENLTALGNLYLARSQAEEALSCYEKALEENPKYTSAISGKGQALLVLGKPEEAQRIIFKALENDPENVQARITLGKTYYDLGRVQMAREEFEKCLSKKPEQIDLLFYMGVVNEYAGEERYGNGFPAQEAIKYYTKALELSPDHLKARTNLGNVYAKIGEWEKAKKEFEQASLSAANSPYAHYNLGYIYDELGLRRQSIEEYLKAIQLDPKFADAYFNLGYVYSEYKLFKLSEREYFKVLDIEREYADAYFNLGVLYDKYLKDKSKAHTYYHEYALRRPNAPSDEKKVLKKRILKLYP